MQSIDQNSHYKPLTASEKPFIIVLKHGDNLFEALLRALKERQMTSASFSGLGALEDVSVAFYDMATKAYNTKLVEGHFELISLNGNLTLADGNPTLHIHAAMGKQDFSLFGGHMMDATVGATAEITVIPFSSQLHRQYDDDIGLKLICPIG